MKNQIETAAAENAIDGNGINLYNSIKSTFSDYAEIQEKSKTWKPNAFGNCMEMRRVKTSDTEFSVGIYRTDYGWMISASVMDGRYAGHYSENVYFNLPSKSASDFADAVYDACAKVLKRETVRNTCTPDGPDDGPDNGPEKAETEVAYEERFGNAREIVNNFIAWKNSEIGKRRISERITFDGIDGMLDKNTYALAMYNAEEDTFEFNVSYGDGEKSYCFPYCVWERLNPDEIARKMAEWAERAETGENPYLSDYSKYPMGRSVELMINLINGCFDDILEVPWSDEGAFSRSFTVAVGSKGEYGLTVDEIAKGVLMFTLADPDGNEIWVCKADTADYACPMDAFEALCFWTDEKLGMILL